MSFLDSLFHWVLSETLRGSVLIVCVLALRAAFRERLPAQCFHLLWLLVAARLLVPLAPPSSFSVFNLVYSERSSPVEWQVRAGVLPMPRSGKVISAQVMESDAPAEPRWNGLQRRLGESLAFVWLAGAVLQTLLLARSAIQMRCRLHSATEIREENVVALLEHCAAAAGLRRKPRLLMTDAVSSPAVMGLWRPRLLLPLNLPERLSENELSFVLLHECTHLRRRDLVALWLPVIARVAHWFNPLVWLAARLARTDVELACDEAVLRRAASDTSVAYGQALLKLAQKVVPMPAVLPAIGILENRDALRTRVARIASYAAPSRFRLTGAVLLIAAVTLAFGANEKTGSASTSAPALAATAVTGEEEGPALKPQVLIEAKLLELPKARANRLVLPNGQAFLHRVPEAKDSGGNPPGPLRRGTLTDEDAETLLRQLKSEPGAGLLSAPRVLTISQQPAIIQIGNEFPYPTGWEPKREGERWMPKDFERRRTGITLEVEPTVDDAGRIDLDLTQQIVEFRGFVDDDTLEPVTATAASAEKQRLRPIFSTRELTASLSVPSGQTIVLLGLGEMEDAAPDPAKDLEKEILVFITARVIERDGETPR